MQYSLYAALAFILFIGGLACFGSDDSSKTQSLFGGIGTLVGAFMLIYPFWAFSM